MGTLYVANCSKQNQEIQYQMHLRWDGNRLVSTVSPPPNNPASRQVLRPGRQEPIGGRNISVDAVQSLVHQLEPHGAVPQSELYGPSARGKKIYLVYSVDKPISEDVIRYVMDVNSGVLVDEGRQRRINAAIVVNEKVQKAVSDTLMSNGIDDEVRTNVDVEVEQVRQSEFEEKKVEEGFKVRADAPDLPPPANKPPRQRRQRAA